MFAILAPSVRAGACLLAGCLVLLSGHLGAAIPPSNDLCSGALIVPGAGPFPYLTPMMDISGATTNGDPFLPAICQGNSNVSRSVWFRFTPAASARYTLSLGPDTATDFADTLNDTVLAIYSAPAGCGGPFTLLLCDDDTLGATYPQLTALSTNLTAGSTYYLVAWVGEASIAANHGQPLKLQLRVSMPVRPANDDCAGAETIPASGPFPYYTSTAVDTLLATTNVTNELSSECALYRATWFKFTPAAAATYIFSTETDTATSVSSTAIAIYSGTCTSLVQVACTNSSGRATLMTPLTSGVTRYILVWDAEADAIPGETYVQLRVSVAGPPAVTTLMASNLTSIGSTNATLAMRINPNGFASRYFFEWGPTTSYGSMTPSVALNVGLGYPQVKTNLLSNFTPGVTYHYRAVGSNAQGKVFGLDQTFIASTNRPTLSGPAVLAGGYFRFEFNGNPGQLYAAHGSSNLVNWVELGGATDLGTGVFEFIHSPGSTPRYRFYKARVR